jgi:hypothetical protein
MKASIHIIIVVSSLFAGCLSNNSGLTALLKTVDSITFRTCDMTGTAFGNPISVTNKEGLDIFNGMIHEKQENLPIATATREVKYFSKGKLILTAYLNAEGVAYKYNNISYSERISYAAGMYFTFDSSQIGKHPDFTPTPNNTLETRVQKLKLMRIVGGCACADWEILKDTSKTGNHKATDSAIFTFIEPADSSLVLSDTVGYEFDIVLFTGQFYKEKSYPKGYDAGEEGVDKDRVFRYTAYKIAKSNYGEIKMENIKRKRLFNPALPFRILSAARSINNQSTASDTNNCKGWSIPKEVLPKIIRDSKMISGTEWDLSFSVLKCTMVGKLEQDGNDFDFEINGGSWFYIHSPDTTLIFGNYTPGDKKYFIDGPGTN